MDVTTNIKAAGSDPDYASGGVDTLASQALNRLMAPGRNTNDRDDDDALTYPAIIEGLSEAFLADDPEMRREAVANVLRSGVTGADFIQSHAGDMSRMLGDLWAENKISFAETTIGVARMQETVRTLASRRHVEMCNISEVEILLIAPDGENHLLGLFVACEAFEDLGCYVHLAIGQSPSEINELAKRRRFAMIGISVSSLRTVKDARAIVQKLRSSHARNVPIVMGGGLATDPTKHIDVLAEIGVDHVICEPEAALKHCGIEIPTRIRKAS